MANESRMAKTAFILGIIGVCAGILSFILLGPLFDPFFTFLDHNSPPLDEPEAMSFVLYTPFVLAIATLLFSIIALVLIKKHNLNGMTKVKWSFWLFILTFIIWYLTKAPLLRFMFS